MMVFSIQLQGEGELQAHPLSLLSPPPLELRRHLHPSPARLARYSYLSQIHSPWLGDIVDSWLSYRPASLCSQSCDFIPPVRDYEFGYCTQINRPSPPLSESVFVNVYVAQESIPSNRFSQTGSRFLDSFTNTGSGWRRRLGYMAKSFTCTVQLWRLTWRPKPNLGVGGP